jgi:soluble lytic murein transglycosylase-like protein
MRESAIARPMTDGIGGAADAGAAPNIIQASLPPGAADPDEPQVEDGELAQAKPQPSPPRQPPKKSPPAPKKAPTPEELAQQAQRRSDRAREWDEIMRTAPKVTQSHQLLPDDWEAHLDKIDPNYARWTKEAAQREGIPPVLLARLLYKESYYNAKAGSLKGAKGIAQLTPITVKELGLNPKTFQYFDPKTSIDTGSTYLARLYRRFGDWPSAVGSYNAGPDWLTRWRDGEDKVKSPSDETKTMLQRIFRGNPKAFQD